jgi:ABC-type glycerol-3-phosphate transport system substrate-binding protein
MPWFGADGVDQFGAASNAYTRTFRITTAAKDPAGIAKFLNWMLTDEAQQLLVYGVEAITTPWKTARSSMISQKTPITIWAAVPARNGAPTSALCDPRRHEGRRDHGVLR